MHAGWKDMGSKQNAWCQMCGEMEQRGRLVTLSKRHIYPASDNHVATQRIKTEEEEVFEVMNLPREDDHHVVNDHERNYHGCLR